MGRLVFDGLFYVYMFCVRLFVVREGLFNWFGVCGGGKGVYI